MPDPKKFDNKNEWMDTCMHQLRKEEHKDQQQSVTICLNMWRDKNKKARNVVVTFLEGIDKEGNIVTDFKKIPRLKERLLQKQERGHGLQKGPKTFADPGEEVTELIPGGKEEKRPYKMVKPVK